MAAGDVILSGVTFTPEDMQKLAEEVHKIEAANSKEPNEFEEVQSIADLTSLPALAQQGAVFKLVRFSIDLLKGLNGKAVKLQATDEAIQWQYEGDSIWIDLVRLSDIQGPQGTAIELRATSTAIEWKYVTEEDTQYRTLVNLSQLKGDKGDFYELRVEGTYLQKRLSENTEGEWVNMLDLTTLYGKTPILETVEVSNGETPSGTFTKTGEDENGHPKYKLNLVVERGKDGQPPVFEQGTTETISSDLPAEVEVVANGETPEGNPQYLLNFKIPRGQNGQDGQGAGNVYVTETGLLPSKQYLFQPSQNNSANGVFVEYVAPNNFPEAPDDGKVYGRNGKTKSWQEITPEAEVSISEQAPEAGAKEKVVYEIQEVPENELPEYVQEAPANDKEYVRKNKAWVHFQAPSSEHTLDVSPLLSIGDEAEGTINDEFLAELQKAYENKYSNAYSSEGAIFPVDIRYDGEFYTVSFELSVGQVGNYTKYAFSYAVEVATKKVVFTPALVNLVNSGNGTKALTDSGRYELFVPEAPQNDKPYARKNAAWVPLDGLGGESHYLIDLDLTGSITSLITDPSDAIPYYGKAYEELTNDNIYEQLGGLEGIKKLHADLRVLSKKNYAVVCPYQYFYCPGYLVFTGVASTAMASDSEFSNEVIQGGQYILYLISDLGTVKVSIRNIGEVDQTATIEFKAVNYLTPLDVRDSFGYNDSNKPMSARLGVELNNKKVASDEIKTIKKLTQSEYDGLSSKSSKTLYIIVG